MSSQLQNLEKLINSELSSKIKNSLISNEEILIEVVESELIDVVQFLKSNEKCKFKQLIDIAGVDYPENEKRFELVYLFLSIEHNIRIKILIKFQIDQMINSLSFGILQATRTRISKTEYISCPSCGRTLFDLQETTAKIRKETDHLKGVKIGIMGCIVNGPGEMADADYGYVGTGKGKITLYKEQTVVEKNIPEDKAVIALINLIKKHGDWIEKN